MRTMSGTCQFCGERCELRCPWTVCVKCQRKAEPILRVVMMNAYVHERERIKRIIQAEKYVSKKKLLAKI